MRMKSVLPSLALLSALVLLCHSCGPAAAAISQRAALEGEMKAAVEEVQRIVPRKRLTEDEMVEINRLYRVIGRCEDELAKLTR